MNTLVIKLSKAYNYQDFYKAISSVDLVDLTELPGTRCYLDDSSKMQIKRDLIPFSANGIHFIDSGNYHYMTLLMMEKITCDFNLVLFDHHPDNQPPSFGQITSCGGWVLEAIETLPHLKNVYTYGTGCEIPPELINSDLPIYISIDKDILAKEYSITDWDQGQMTFDELLDIIDRLLSQHDYIGVDICGDSSEFAQEAAKLNNEINTKLFNHFQRIPFVILP